MEVKKLLESRAFRSWNKGYEIFQLEYEKIMANGVGVYKPRIPADAKYKYLRYGDWWLVD